MVLNALRIRSRGFFWSDCAPILNYPFTMGRPIFCRFFKTVCLLTRGSIICLRNSDLWPPPQIGKAVAQAGFGCVSGSKCAHLCLCRLKILAGNRRAGPKRCQRVLFGRLCRLPSGLNSTKRMPILSMPKMSIFKESAGCIQGASRGSGIDTPARHDQGDRVLSQAAIRHPPRAALHPARIAQNGHCGRLRFEEDIAHKCY